MRRYTHDEMHHAMYDRFGGSVEPERQACHCPYWVPLGGILGPDWGTVANPESPRFGEVVFEHDGCACPDHGGEWRKGWRDQWLDRKRERERRT